MRVEGHEVSGAAEHGALLDDCGLTGTADHVGMAADGEGAFGKAEEEFPSPRPSPKGRGRAGGGLGVEGSLDAGDGVAAGSGCGTSDRSNSVISG